MTDLGPHVVLFDLWQPVPVFHQPRPYQPVVALPDGWRRNRQRTSCGRELYLVEWRDRPGATQAPWSDIRLDRQRGTWLPSRHAARFGRPCRLCYP